MIRTLTIAALLIMVSTQSALAVGEAVVENTRWYTHPKLQQTVLGGELNLPAEGWWTVMQPEPGSPLGHVYLVPLEIEPDQRSSRRVTQANNMRRGRSEVGQWFNEIQKFARTNNGIGPASFEELSHTMDPRLRSKWVADQSSEVKGDLLFLVPQVPIIDRTARGPMRSEDAQPLVVELHPYVADGKHWVLLSNGVGERRPIDQDLVKRYALGITPVVTATGPPTVAPPEVRRYQLVALKQEDIGTPILLTIENRRTNQQMVSSWDTRNPAAGGADLMKTWATARSGRWVAMLPQPSSGVLRTWARSYRELYRTELGPETASMLHSRVTSPRQERTESLPGVLGGRAAIRETLQLEAINPSRGSPKQKDAVPIDSIAGVQVKSHSFTELLQGKPGGRLPLADCVPHDHGFAYFANPAALIGFLDHGSDYLAQIGALMSQTRVDDELEAKYLGRLGLDGHWARTFLRHGAVTELGVILPDLFLIDGTEMTIVMRVPKMALAKPLLQLLGLPDLSKGEPVTVTLRHGGKAHWAVRGDLLLVSTHLGELQQVLQLHRQNGTGSLGHSAEFRYMLTCLPVQSTTISYAYLSDPFIRKLVSPATKIAQLRKLKAQAEMLSITAGALLYQADHQPRQTDRPSLAKLSELGYVPADLTANSDYTLREDGVVESGRYGALARPASLLAQPVTSATAAEAAAYQQYLDQYRQYWRQYFDPIALRLDEMDGGRFQLSTFILPLVASELYNQVRAFVASQETGTALQVPDLAHQPVLTLSVNLGEEGWRDAAGGLSDLFEHYSRLDPEILDYLGPGMHLAIADSDPIIAFGSGDLTGALDTSQMSERGRGMFYLPILLSALTRPSTLIVELTDPQRVLMLLKQSANRPIRPGAGFFATMSLHQMEDRYAWICKLDILNIIHLSFGLEVQGNYLIITNLPWSQRPQVTGSHTAELNGALLQASPGAVEQQLPALYTATVAQERAAAMQSIGLLYPLLASGCQTADEAVAAHARLFGYKPLPPARGEWLWQDGVLSSSAFGTPTAQKQPDYQPGNRDFGMLPAAVDQLKINMQFQDAGLRADISWSWQDR